MTVDRSARLPGPPYTLRVADLRVRRPGGEVRFEDEFALPPGRRLALVGAGRARASALTGVLLGLLDYEGTATLNDVQLGDLAGEDVRGVIGLRTRAPGVFDDGVRTSADGPVLIVDESAAGGLGAAGDRTLLLITCRAAVPGATPILRWFDEVRVLGGD